jgi:hypothetical protein
MQLVVEMWPCSMSATGRLRFSIAREQITHMAANGRRDVALEILLGAVFGVLLELVGYVFVNRLLASCRPE